MANYVTLHSFRRCLTINIERRDISLLSTTEVSRITILYKVSFTNHILLLLFTFARLDEYFFSEVTLQTD